MAVVALIPTGNLEHAAIAEALGPLFPDDTFLVRPPEQHLNGFTSRDVAGLAANPSGPVPTELDDLVAELVNAIFPGRRGERIDFAVVVEDLELVNDHQPELVLRVFRDAVERYIQATWPQTSSPRFAEVRERCSFHLFRPMTEAYFFGEPAALQRAGAVQPPHLSAGLDLEQFRTTDSTFLALPPRTDRISDMPNRERHPKSYLHYLCDPTLADRRRRYRETHGGVDALRTLDWQQVISVPPHCPFLHAFLDDLTAALNRALPFVHQAHTDPRTRFPGSTARILRNL
jgi:hypothetical protein